MRIHRHARLPRPVAACLAAVFALSAAGGVLAAAGPAQAAPAAPGNNSTISFGVRPADERDYFHVDLARGQTVVRPATVTNFAPDPVDLLVYPSDATVTSQGGFALADRSEPVKRVGSWIHLPVGRLHLAGYASTTVRFPLTVPTDATPGDYAGGVVAQKVTPGTVSTVQQGFAVQLDIVQRVGARVYLHVDGDAKPGLRVGKLTWKKTGNHITFSLPVTNTGNIRLQPVTQVQLRGFNLPATPIPTSRIEELLPGSTVTVTGRLAKPPAFGTGDATATVRYAGYVTAARTSVSLVAVLPLLGLLAAIAVIVVGLWKIASFVRRARTALRLANELGAAVK
jgi:hypothetical protein